MRETPEINMRNTAEQFDKIMKECRMLYIKKWNDYGTAWRILRLTALTDQVYIKAKRIRSLQEKGIAKVGEGIESEFIGIINYCIMALIQIELKDSTELELSQEEAVRLYDRFASQTKELMENKNHDYGEAWRDMRVESITDIILMKLLRVKKIEDHAGKTCVSEGIDANYTDIINYSIFAMILLEEKEAQKTNI